MDGIALVRRVRAELESPPPILVVTALSSGDARSHALEAGADDYLAKPYEPRKVLRRLKSCIARQLQPTPDPVDSKDMPSPAALSSDHIGVALVASTGGPEALRKLLAELDPNLPATYFLILHGPAWMLETFADRMRDVSPLDVRLAADHARIEVGGVLVCPGDFHMKIDGSGQKIRLTTEPPENFVRPAADPLLRSLAAVYGTRAVGVILTGMGRDGSLGSQHVHAAGGTVLIQNPNTAVASSMPRTALSMGTADQILDLDQIPDALHRTIRRLSPALADTPA
jgi:two-component system chemotaxis response regulator CheB